MNNNLGIDKVYSVLELNNVVRSVIKKGFPESIWLCGEIQGLRVQRGKNHIYFSLVQKDPDSENIVAQVDANLFAGIRPLIEKRIREAQGAFELKDDIEVKFLCEVDLYAPRGKFNVNIKDIDPVYTLGKVAQNRLKIIDELKAKGLLEKNKMALIPDLPLKVGLITSYDSAAYHDFTNELILSGFGFKVLAYNCHMQGALVEKDVLGAIDYFNRLSPNELDVIIITRGGGSISDLAYFDNKKIAESIANSKFAVITGLGHQINTTIADMVAHSLCKTPTKAAQLLVEKISQFSQNLDYFQEKITNQVKSLLESSRGRLQNLTLNIDSVALRYFRVQHEEVLEKKHLLVSRSTLALTRQREALKGMSAILKVNLPAIFKDLSLRLEHLKQKIKILDPRQVLRRGYSLTYKNGRIFKSVKNIQVGDEFTTVLYDGKLESEVKKKENDDE
ncbi:MAG: exodeoxyribonuclease VII large subunit [Candidatus Omnitrophica bacterium]|nr:exodeoxyribonuclease VII large subunit [Candidatus Omnitrophota bacterium]